MGDGGEGSGGAEPVIHSKASTASRKYSFDLTGNQRKSFKMGVI